ncbi:MULTISPECIES: sugar kinase [unclassified Streptomyces]|uniref:sugar kinase n=1 Tax=unclassified Streptomyces TaxID=2593676 RepID=UPI00081E6FBA|nr:MULTISPECIES: sugar kinase [unclassified Streptomyces]MYZ33764.1 sugar kinase [Streptomyces sp. SID4917]SCF61599.1 2-dehydro-3-deoxygluconokinase [Streptomyces sp. MnatMP-M17]
MTSVHDASAHHASAHNGRRLIGTGPVVCVGETMAALAPEPVAPLDDTELLRLDIAGAESNVAMYLADHGVPVRWISALGDDPFGARIRRRVASSGVDVTGVRTDPTRPTGLLIKNPGADGTRVLYYRRGSAASALGPDVLRSTAVREAGLVHLTGITPALSASCLALVEEALAPDRPCPVSFDVNHRAALWTGRSAPEILRTLADRADLVFVGLDEAQALWGPAVTDAAAVRALLPGPHTLVVKDGAREATAYLGPVPHSVPAPRVEVVEPVGAGDAFAAGFLAGLRTNGDPVHALRLGHLTAASALRVTADHGPLPPPARLRQLLTADEETWATHQPT